MGFQSYQHKIILNLIKLMFNVISFCQIYSSKTASFTITRRTSLKMSKMIISFNRYLLPQGSSVEMLMAFKKPYSIRKSKLLL